MAVLSCPLHCGHVSLNSQMLKDHLKSHFDNVKCPFCSMIIENIYSLPAHLDECSIKTEENIVEEENLSEKGETNEGEYDTEIISVLPDELTEEELCEINIVNPVSSTVDETNKVNSQYDGVHVKTETKTPKADSRTSTFLKTYLTKLIEKKPKTAEFANGSNPPFLKIGKNVTISRILKPPKVEVKSKTEANSDTDEAEDEIKEEEVEEKDEGESESHHQKQDEGVKEFLKLEEPESEEETEQDQEQELSPAVQEEVVTEDNNTDTDETEDDDNVYQCSTCDANFTDVKQHLAEYHSNHQVYLQLPEEDGKDGGDKTKIKDDPLDDDVEMSNLPSAANETKDQAIWVNWNGMFYLSTRDPLKKFQSAKNPNYVVRPQTKNFSVSNLRPFYMEDDYGDKFFSVPVDTAIDYFEASNGRCGPKRFVGNFARVCIGSVVQSKRGSRPIQIYERVISTHSLSLTHILFSSMPPEHFLPIIVQMNPKAGCHQGIKYKIYWKCSLCEVEVDSWSLHDCDDVLVDMKEAVTVNIDCDINLVHQLTEDGEDKHNTNKENYDSEQNETVQGNEFKKIKPVKPKKNTKAENPSITRHTSKKYNITIPKAGIEATGDAADSKMGQFYCRPCKIRCFTEKGLQDHRKNDHRHKPGYQKNPDIEIIQSGAGDPADRTCTDCKGRYSGDPGLVFEARPWYLLHRKTVHGDKVKESELPVISGRTLVAGLKAQFKTKKKGEEGYNNKDTPSLEPDEIVSSDGPLEPKILRTCSKCVRVKNSIYSLRKHLRDFHGDDSIVLEEDDDEEKDNPSGSAKESPEDSDHDLYQIAEIAAKKEKTDLYKFNQDGIGLENMQNRYAENNVIEIDLYSSTCLLCNQENMETPYNLVKHMEFHHLSQFSSESFFFTRRRLMKLIRAKTRGLTQVTVGNDEESTATQEDSDSALDSLIQTLEGEEGENGPSPKRRKLEILKAKGLKMMKLRTKVKDTARPKSTKNPIRVRDMGDLDFKGIVISDEPDCEEDRTATLSIDILDFINFKEKVFKKKTQVNNTGKKVKRQQSLWKKSIKLTGINAGKEVKHSSVLDFNGDPQTSCMTCKVTFVNTRWLERHRDCFHKNNCRECPICSLLIQEDVMEMHMAGHNKSQEDLAAAYNGKYQRDIDFTCRECNHSFESEEHLSYHSLVHQNKVMLVHKEKCSYCAAEFYEPAMLRNHLKMHSSRRVYSCNYCNKLFYKLSEKVSHERIHTGEKPFACEDCGKVFRKKALLVIHRRHVHLNERRYACDIDGCGLRFVSNSSMTIHKQRHDKTPRYKCKYCPKMFSSTGTRANHQRRNHNNTVEYVCKICTRKFRGMSVLQQHYAKHEALVMKYVCHYCPQAFGSSLFLSKHLEEVHGEDSKH